MQTKKVREGMVHQKDLCEFLSQLGLRSEFQDSLGGTERPCPKNKNKKTARGDNREERKGTNPETGLRSGKRWVAWLPPLHTRVTEVHEVQFEFRERKQQ